MRRQFKVDKLHVRIHEGRSAMGKDVAAMVANKITSLLAEKDVINIIFAAAPSQNEFLDALTEKHIDWPRINAFHMDEYIGLSNQAPQGFGNFLKEKIFKKCNFRSVHYLDGNTPDVHAECSRYAELLLNHPTDIACMGIGENGHLAFNDPPVAKFNDEQMVKLVELDAACRVQQVNDGCFNTLNEVPTHAITLTIPALMAASFIFCTVPALSKAEAVYNTLNQQITEQYPSTILRCHDNAILILDGLSSSLLSAISNQDINA